jgi:hypothetical protein
MTDKGELADDPEVDLVGIPEKNAAGEVIDEIVFDTVVSDGGKPAAGAAARCGRDGGIGAPRGAGRHQRELGQEADLPRSCADGLR